MYDSSVYDIISEDFSRTRYKMWPSVIKFLDNLRHKYILDVGCGNGKNQTIHSKDILFESCDLSKLCQITQKRFNNVSIANMTHLPYRSNSFDACICIAAFHHLDTIESRHMCLREIKRILRESGQCIITVWVPDKYKESEAMIPWTLKKEGSIEIVHRYYHIFTKDELFNLISTYFVILKIEYQKENWNVTCTNDLS